jgi:GT2 family glycosyltransferase
MSRIPDEVRRLAAERDERRAAKDFAAADELRDRIGELGYRVVDGPTGSSLEPIEAATVERVRPSDVASVLEEAPTADASVHWVCEGWPEDISRALDGFRAAAGVLEVQYVVADVTGETPEAFGEDVEVVTLVPDAGWAAARNAGLRRSRGEIVLAVDGSIEPTGDVFGPLRQTLADANVGVCGPFGIVSEDVRTFESSAGIGPGREVDAVEGYLMAFRRDVLVRVGPFDERFRWYRTADIEWSFRVKDAGLRAVVVDVPVERHEHRMWSSTSPDERDRLSKRNFYRFLERFRGRTDLLVRPRD